MKKTKMPKTLQIFNKFLFFILAFMMSHMTYAWVNQDTQAFLKSYYKSEKKIFKQVSSINKDKKIQIYNKSIMVNREPLLLTIVRPSQSKQNIPVFMYFHGGGWVSGSFKEYGSLLQNLVLNSNTAAVFVHYSLSPKVHFPVAINQAYAATQWISKHGKELHLDGKRLAVVGDSAGGNMAAVVSLMAKNNKDPSILLQVLICPVLNAKFDTPSYKEFSTRYFLTKKDMQYFWDAYIPIHQERSQINASPLQASIQELKGLPVTLIQSAENDVLRDEAERYAMKLDQAGVPVISVRYDGTVHDFAAFDSLNKVSASQEAFLQVADFLKNHL